MQHVTTVGHALLVLLVISPTPPLVFAQHALLEHTTVMVQVLVMNVRFPLLAPAVTLPLVSATNVQLGMVLTTMHVSRAHLELLEMVLGLALPAQTPRNVAPATARLVFVHSVPVPPVSVHQVSAEIAHTDISLIHQAIVFHAHQALVVHPAPHVISSLEHALVVLLVPISIPHQFVNHVHLGNTAVSIPPLAATALMVLVAVIASIALNHLGIAHNVWLDLLLFMDCLLYTSRRG
mgnify:CR=1 FL=1